MTVTPIVECPPQLIGFTLCLSKEEAKIFVDYWKKNADCCSEYCILMDNLTDALVNSGE